jgi:hypothetical protein
MSAMKRESLFLVLCLAILPAAMRAEEGLHYRAADPSAPAVTEKNLLASERFWPYQVALAKPLPLASGQELPAGWEGVLIRVEPGGRARIDFGRDGLLELPLTSTDLVQRSERIRLGELDKMAPNFVLALGTRLLDAAAEPPRTFGIEAALKRPGFLAVFADPSAASFASLADALRPLQDRHGVLTVLFPLGRHPDAEVYEKLRALKWTPAFVFDHLADGYTTSLIDEGTPKPALQLQTNEGRVLFEGAFRPDVLPELTAALDGAFGVDAGSSSTAKLE